MTLTSTNRFSGMQHAKNECLDASSWMERAALMHYDSRLVHCQFTIRYIE